VLINGTFHGNEAQSPMLPGRGGGIVLPTIQTFMA
jgi:hypothetical protein